MFEAFEHARRPNTDAIAQMALENYVEMREAVLDPEYRKKKAEAEALEKKDPNFIPRYSMVMFHPEIPYFARAARSASKSQSQLTVTRNRNSKYGLPPAFPGIVPSGRRRSVRHRGVIAVRIGHRHIASTWRHCRWRNPIVGRRCSTR